MSKFNWLRIQKSDDREVAKNMAKPTSNIMSGMDSNMESRRAFFKAIVVFSAAKPSQGPNASRHTHTHNTAHHSTKHKTAQHNTTHHKAQHNTSHHITTQHHRHTQKLRRLFTQSEGTWSLFQKHTGSLPSSAFRPVSHTQGRQDVWVRRAHAMLECD